MDSKTAPNISNKSGIEIVIDNNCHTPMNNNATKMVGLYAHFVSTILVKFHAGYFGISLALCAQVLLWKTLVEFTKDTQDNSQSLHHPTILLIIPTTATNLLWSMALAVQISLSTFYVLKCFHHFGKVKKEFLHHVGVNYMFAPWISCLFLLQTLPNFIVPRGNSTYGQIIWWVIVMPIIVLDIKLYGQWFTKGKRFLAREANPASQHSVIANLVAANAAINVGCFEIGLCLFSLGMAHYFVLFVTLYQRLPASNGVSVTLRPVFFLFFGTPSMGSLAWSSISGNFGIASKMLYFLSMFLFMSLICRPTLFQKSLRKFSIAWWAFSFPLTLLALASIEYAQEVKDGATQALALVLSIISMVVSFALMIITTIKLNKLFLTT